MMILALQLFHWNLVGPQRSVRHWDCCRCESQGLTSVLSHLKN